MAIKLPTTPTGEQYEDLVAASLKALGYFTETRLVLREGKKEVLELDVVATPNPNDPSARRLYEAKKDGFSFPNLFKLFGQRMYLDIAEGCLVSLRGLDPEFAEVYESIGRELNVRLCNHTLDDMAIDRLANPSNELSPELRARIVGVAWFQQIGKRLAYAFFVQECSRNKGVTLYEQGRTYNHDVLGSFFMRTPLARAEALYEAYTKSPRLPGEFVSQIAENIGRSVRDVWNQVNDSGEYIWIQYLMLLEHTARVAIIKNALDDLLERGQGPIPGKRVKMGKSEVTLPDHILPQSFWDGLQALGEHKHSLRLPFLFQAFVELLGGFLFFRDRDELGMLSALTGIPAEEVVDSLRVLDKFFAPADGTWFYEQKGQLLCMKMVPGFTRGGGCFLRRTWYAINEYVEKFPDMAWLLSRWHNTLYFLLEPHLKIAEETQAGGKEAGAQ